MKTLKNSAELCTLMNKKLIIFLLVLFLTGCVTIYNPATQQHENYLISEKSEIGMGQNMAREITTTKKMVTDQETIRQVTSLGESIAKVSDRKDLDFHFYVLDDTTMNAFALPGGYVIVHKGLIDKTSQDELAFVLSHEIGHICARHSLKRLQANMGMNIVSIALTANDLSAVNQGLSIVYDVVSKGYSREDELLADKLGLKYSSDAGYDPKAVVSLLKKLEKDDQGSPIVFFRSHPKIKDRIAAVEKILK